jgi:hypothetical protein
VAAEPVSEISATPFSGAPACLAARCSLQPMSKPQFDGRSGAVSTPAACSAGSQAPSEPSRGQLPPPSASSTASARTVTSPAGAWKRSTTSPRASGCNAPGCQRCRMCSRTPAARSRCSQARSSGAAFISSGKTRPELPTKVPMPSPVAQSRSACGPKASSQRPTSPARSP